MPWNWIAKTAHDEVPHSQISRFSFGMICAPPAAMDGAAKRIVYIIRSDADSSRHYVGLTSHVADRLEWHNHGLSGHTVSNRPWSLVVSMEFSTERDAVRFEKYLKSGSGRAFTKRHFGTVGRDE